MILPISASQVARITEVSHQRWQKITVSFYHHPATQTHSSIRSHDLYLAVLSQPSKGHSLFFPLHLHVRSSCFVSFSFLSLILAAVESWLLFSLNFVLPLAFYRVTRPYFSNTCDWWMLFKKLNGKCWLVSIFLSLPSHHLS
jgi:hypothetical protein